MSTKTVNIAATKLDMEDAMKKADKVGYSPMQDAEIEKIEDKTVWSRRREELVTIQTRLNRIIEQIGNFRKLQPVEITDAFFEKCTEPVRLMRKEVVRELTCLSKIKKKFAR